MKSIFKLISNSQGVSLPELMIGGGILAGVALAGAQLFKDQKVAQKKVEYDQKLAIFHNNLSKFINLPENCNATLKNFISNGSSLTAPLTVSALYRCSSGCRDTNSTANLDYNAYTPGAYAGVVHLASNSFIDNSRTWRVDSMRIIDSRNNTGTARLRINYSLDLDGTGGAAPKVISKDVFLNLRFSSGTFKECLGSQESNVNNLQSDLCKSLNLQEVSSNGTLATWDDATQTCVVSGNRTCLAGEEAYMASDGSARCRPIVKSGDAAALESSTTATCSNPVMVFENNQVVVKCP